ncbi:MAG: hypothetical protein Q8K78_17550, partial [Planctomycetaceae bacterium]|nr:hypothetical protein [Planctomycetaceae bacterium]
DTLFDFGIRQVIEGPDVGKFRNSALSGRRHALLPNMLGLNTDGKKLDFSPYNGTALTSADSRYLAINDSGSANNGNPVQSNRLANLDPDYTYPDNTNVFLSYMGYDPVQGRKIIIPSFHRPQAGSVRSLADWYENSATANQVLRPHPNHIWMPTAGQRPPNPAVPRFLKTSDLAALGGNWSTWGAFPFAPYNGDGGAVGEQGVWSLTSPPTAGAALPATADAYEYDVDNDGDGIREGVWLDVDFPLLEDASGMQYVPLFSYTIVDADALLNLNVHGNMARVWNGDVPLDRIPFRYSAADPFISKSNQGLIASEVNPLWALNRRPPVTSGSFPASAYDSSYAADPFFGGTVGGPVPENWKEAANRDWLYLLMGRYSTTPSDLVPGRWGEEHLLYRAITNTPVFNALGFSLDNTLSNILPNPWPGPGQTQTDDNGDLPKVTGDWFGSTNQQAFGMPLDYTGLGSYWQTASPKLGNYGLTAGLPARWPMFNRYSSSSTRPVQWPNTGLSGTLAYGLFNDAGEMVIDSDAKRDEDGVFGVEEMQALHLVNTDFAVTTGGQSRLTQLAPYNFDATFATIGSGSNARSTQGFRSKFTTRSWDRKQHSIGYNASSTTRAWEFGVHNYDDADLSLYRRALNSSSPSLYFPPQFGAGTSIPYAQGYMGPSAYQPSVNGPADPYRPLLRKLVEVEANNFSQTNYQLRLNLNQLLVGPSGNPEPQFQHPSNPQSPKAKLPPNIQLNYRPLTPHPSQSVLPATPINNEMTNLGLSYQYPSNGNFTSPVQQEYWARRDRQMMARDYFMLLYTLTWPEASMSAANNPAQASFASDVNNQPAIRQLAQYAANIVDSIDGDNIPTRFEFDMNVTDGWGLDDDPYTVDTGTTRYEVFGVERLDLTLSEALVVRAEENTTDFPFTQWNETGGDKHFAYVELRNPGPNTVNLSSRAWRIELGRDYTDQTNSPSVDVRWLQLRAGSVNPGELYTIGSVDGSTIPATYPSIMKVDPSGSTPADWDAPMTTWIAPAQQTLDLDLRDTAAAANFLLTDGTGAAVTTPRALYDNDVFTRMGGLGATEPLFVRLYRRVSPDRTMPNSSTEESDNPYVLVDEIAINNIGTSTNSSQGGVLQFVASDPAIATKLGNLRSRQHAEPMSISSSSGYAYTTSTGAYGNTLGNSNSATDTFRNWQKVFDRDFASVGELLQVTLGGFSNSERLRTDGLTTSMPLGRAALPGIATRINVDTASTNAWHLQTQTSATASSVDASAQQMFFPVPQGASAAGPPRWHRFLELVEVPSRMQASIPGFPIPLDYPRVPGKININMLRNPDVLAALIDDPTIMSFRVDEDADLNGSFGTGEDLNNDGFLDLLTNADGNPTPLLTRSDQTVSSPPPGYMPYNDATTRTIGVSPNQSDIKSWWDGLIASRDGQVSTSAPMVSPYNGAVSNDETGLFLPGLPAEAGPGLTGSRPFRSFAAADQTATRPFATVQDTLLRAWPGESSNATSAGTADPRGLFELGTLDEHLGRDSVGNTVTTLDPYVRSRILNKIMNNVTTRSNVFVIFASIKYFRAHRHASGAVQIGGPLKDPSFLDSERSKPELRRFYVVDRSQIEKAYDPQSGTFNFRALIEFEQDLPLQ